ncbi:hypothetical protein GGR56DRAFT_146714 [Xylariaceae sp. FL0804]|nr:hypothetical protein GGR56DRAFT_146714 [Xylariaceae sp. FL0804]
MATKQDYQVASMAFGFTLGFGFLTVWEAIKHTRRNKNPLRSAFIYMIWGELAANLGIAILGWIFLDGIVGPTVPVFFVILCMWVLQIQLLMQMIINRIAVISESQQLVSRIKWTTFVVISLINCCVFVVFIPAHLSPPPVPILVHVNKYWDPTSKILICLVDAGLNWYFLRTVKERLVNEHGLMKYKPLVGFNAKLMVLSICMDLLLIGLMWLPNETVFIQFHPVVYLTKLNIEMTMANLILKLARRNHQDAHHHWLSYSNEPHQEYNREPSNPERDVALKSFNRATVKASPGESDSDSGEISPVDKGGMKGGMKGGINRTIDYHVTVSDAPPSKKGRDDRQSFSDLEDEISLANNPGHPRTTTFAV